MNSHFLFAHRRKIQYIWMETWLLRSLWEKTNEASYRSEVMWESPSNKKQSHIYCPPTVAFPALTEVWFGGQLLNFSMILSIKNSLFKPLSINFFYSSPLSLSRSESSSLSPHSCFSCFTVKSQVEGSSLYSLQLMRWVVICYLMNGQIVWLKYTRPHRLR